MLTTIRCESYRAHVFWSDLCTSFETSAFLALIDRLAGQCDLGVRFFRPNKVVPQACVSTTAKIMIEIEIELIFNVAG